MRATAHFTPSSDMLKKGRPQPHRGAARAAQDEGLAARDEGPHETRGRPGGPTTEQQPHRGAARAEGPHKTRGRARRGAARDEGPARGADRTAEQHAPRLLSTLQCEKTAHIDSSSNDMKQNLSGPKLGHLTL